MYLRELTQEAVVDDAVIFHDTLNPALWKNNQLKPQIRLKLLEIAKNFIEFIDVPTLSLKDITLSGSNAAYTYTKHSDLDLHLLVDVKGNEAAYLKQLYDAKKNQYNFTHDIKVKGIDVEVYVQDRAQPHHSAGIYSVLDNRWLTEPKNERVNINDDDVQDKVNNYMGKITAALQDDSIGLARDVSDEIAKIRKSGLASGGEFSIENLAFKVLRAKGYIDKLKQHINNLEDKALSLENQQ
jgi:hypothetical protein